MGSSFEKISFSDFPEVTLLCLRCWLIGAYCFVCRSTRSSSSRSCTRLRRHARWISSHKNQLLCYKVKLAPLVSRIELKGNILEIPRDASFQAPGGITACNIIPVLQSSAWPCKRCLAAGQRSPKITDSRSPDMQCPCDSFPAIFYNAVLHSASNPLPWILIVEISVAAVSIDSSH
jgi:hypothetical protein